MFKKVTEMAKIGDQTAEKLGAEEAEDAKAKAAVTKAKASLAEATNSGDEGAIAKATERVTAAERRLEVEMKETKTAKKRDEMADMAEAAVRKAASKLAELETVMAMADSPAKLVAAKKAKTSADAGGNELEIMAADTAVKALEKKEKDAM